MAWKKGAVVIVKRGDQEWGDTIEDALNIKKASDKELEELRNENETLKRDKDLGSIHDNKFTNLAIQSLCNKYKKKKDPPKWAKIVMEGFAFIVYLVSIFFDKFLTIK